MIVFLSLCVFGFGARADASFSLRRMAAAAVAFAGAFALAAQVLAVASWGTFSGPYAVSLLGLLIAAVVDAKQRKLLSNGRGGSLASEILGRFLRHRSAVVAAGVLALLIELALWAGIIEHALGVEHALASMSNRHAPAGFPHLMGTDQLSRDVFVRLLFGGRISLVVGLSAALLSAIVGATIGLYSGTRGGVVDALLMRVTDAMLSIPILPLLLITSALDLGALSLAQVAQVAAALGAAAAAVVMAIRSWRQSFAVGQLLVEGAAVFTFIVCTALFFGAVLNADFAIEMQLSSVTKIVLLIVAFGWMPIARLSRAAAIELKQREFVLAARALGASEGRVLMRHVLPSALPPIVIAATLDVGANILYEAALSYLGLGVKPPVASWGNMLDHALVLIRTHPALAFWPGVFILATVTCFNLVGDGLRDAIDPHSARKSGP